MTKITLDLPEGLHRVLNVDAVIQAVTIEEVASEYIKNQVESHLELPEIYHQTIQETYKDPKTRGRRKHKAAT